MESIINKVNTVDPSNSDAVKDVVSHFIQTFSKAPSRDKVKYFETLENIINRFPKYCMTHRSSIENIIIKFLESEHEYGVIGAAKCAHVLQQVRPSQEKTATPKTSWREQMSALCGAAHSLISELFVDVMDNGYLENTDTATSTTPMGVALREITSINLNGTQSSIHQRPDLLTLRLKNLFIFIQAMLVEIYPVAKPVRPQLILDLIIRAVTNKTNSKVENASEIKMAALRTLDALVVCLGSNLIPFSPLVFRLTMQALKWTSENPSDQTSSVRQQAYKSVYLWLTTLHCHKLESLRRDSKGKSYEDELINCILEDITPKRHVVELVASGQSTKSLSKKAKRKLANSMLMESNISSHMPGDKNKVKISQSENEDVIVSALECLEMFLMVCGIFLKPAAHKAIQDRLVRECHNLNNFSNIKSLYLLRALDASRKGVCATVPPPTQYCLHIYSSMVNSRDVEISRFCTQALLDIRLHLHCAPPTISYSLQTPINEEKETGTKKIISEKNRAALESLLGSQKILDEEVITINDEPSSKKPRLDNSENITVSSHSSIEISDDDLSIEEVEMETYENKDKQVDETTKENYYISAMNEVKCSPIKENSKMDNLTELDTIDSMNVIPITNESNDKVTTLHEAKTQIPVLSNDSIDGSQHSDEIDYDNPNGLNTKPLEKIEEDHIVSTNETDDVITCGQTILSQDKEFDIKDKESDNKENEPKVNGVKDVNATKLNDIQESKVSVEDMLADFVDEVNDEVV